MPKRRARFPHRYTTGASREKARAAARAAFDRRQLRKARDASIAFREHDQRVAAKSKSNIDPGTVAIVDGDRISVVLFGSIDIRVAQVERDLQIE